MIHSHLMPDKIKIIDKLKLVSVTSYGVVTKNDIHESIETINRLFSEGKINKVIVDTTKQENMPSSMQLYNLSKELPYGLKMALIGFKEQMTIEDLKFFELTSSNKGKQMRIFESVEEANKWLNE